MKSLGYTAMLGACLVALGLVAGCSSNKVAPGGVAMNQATADDFAVQAVAGLDVVSGDVQVAVSATPPPSPMSSRVAPARALWDTTYTGSNGLSYSASRTFYNAADVALPGWTPLATRLHWTSTATGTIANAQDTLTVGHESVLDARGIEAGQDTLRFDGFCVDTLFNRFRSLDGLRTSFFLWTSGVEIGSIRILKSTFQSDGRPISGTVTITVSADRLRTHNRTDVEAHIDGTVVVVFNSNGTADITVASYHYRWNLATQTITRA